MISGRQLARPEALQIGTTAIIDHHESPNAIEGSLGHRRRLCRRSACPVVCAYGVTDRHGGRGAAASKTAVPRRGQRQAGRDRHFHDAATTPSRRQGSQEVRGRRPYPRLRGPRMPADARPPARNQPVAAPTVCIAPSPRPGRNIVHNPFSNLNNSVGATRTRRGSQPVALGPTGSGRIWSRRSGSPTPSALGRRHRLARDGWGLARVGWDLVPGRGTTGSLVAEPMTPWNVAFTPGIRLVQVESVARSPTRRAADGRCRRDRARP